MSKKLAEGLDRLVLDVKFGSGAFMKSREDAAQLADALVAAGNLGNISIAAILSPMDEPLGASAGDALEVRECIELMHGLGPPDLESLILDLAAALSPTPRATHAARLRDGTVWNRFKAMVAAQCDNKDPDLLGIGRALHVAPVITDLPSPASGIITRADAATIGQAVLALGAGRSRADDSIDPTVGIDHLRKTGTAIKAGDPLCRIHARSQADAATAASTLATAFSIA